METKLTRLHVKCQKYHMELCISTYPVELVMCDVECTTFRALYKGYNHWASGRVDKIEVNTQNLFYCCIRCSVTPSMKQGQYKVYLLCHRADGYGDIKTASCQCAAG